MDPRRNLDDVKLGRVYEVSIGMEKWHEAWITLLNWRLKSTTIYFLVDIHKSESKLQLKDVMLCWTCQCHNGHTLCSNCKSRVHNKCPTCRQELGDIRCLALEKVAESLELPCKYYNIGCAEIFPYYGKLKHEAHCTFRPYNCPYAGSECSVTGDVKSLVAHLRDDHKVDMHTGCTFNHRYVKSNPREVENATWMLTVFNCFGQYFCLHFEAFLLGNAPVYMAFLRFMGDDNEAKNFSYSLEVGANGRKMIWQGVPRSIRDSHRKVRDSHDGLIIQRNMALFFSGGGEERVEAEGHWANLERTMRHDLYRLQLCYRGRRSC
ncbi:hypothetical protein KI387_003728 [Taxus chinensis]|uniref:RING-type E3 ubiquitin transferase n=1 Tax=Taxus chinensis TaxID=29808 RepID=A0AA38H320_TAXCH|nr:hypothetical protein KI387_003728 [Taxus chinensis]